MTVGTSNPMGSALHGEFNIQQVTLATDILTLTGAASQSGDFIVCRTSTPTEVFSVDVSGNVVAAADITCVNVKPSGYVATKHAAATTIALTDLGTNGGLGVGILTGTAQLYARQNGTLYRVALTAA